MQDFFHQQYPFQKKDIGQQSTCFCPSHFEVPWQLPSPVNQSDHRHPHRTCLTLTEGFPAFICCNGIFTCMFNGLFWFWRDLQNSLEGNIYLVNVSGIYIYIFIYWQLGDYMLLATFYTNLKNRSTFGDV